MIRIKKKKQPEEINSSSMADIAFLLLIFFLVTTTISNDKGLPFLLPKPPEKDIIDVDIKTRNIFKVLLNSNNQLLVEGEVLEVEELRAKTIEFIDNRGRRSDLSESPALAIVSFKTDRGTDFKTYLQVLDELKAAYQQLRSDYLGIDLEDYLKLDPTEAEDNALISTGLKEYPPTLSEAEPTDFSK